jgi:hypothetical protein
MCSLSKLIKFTLIFAIMIKHAVYENAKMLCRYYVDNLQKKGKGPS